MLSREQILAAQDRPFEDVEVPEWGGTVRVRALGCDQKDALDSAIVRVEQDGKVERDMGHWRAKWLELTLVNEQNQPLFTPADAAALGERSPSVADRLIAVATRLSYPQGATVADAEKN